MFSTALLFPTFLVGENIVSLDLCVISGTQVRMDESDAETSDQTLDLESAMAAYRNRQASNAAPEEIATQQQPALDNSFILSSSITDSPLSAPPRKPNFSEEDKAYLIEQFEKNRQILEVKFRNQEARRCIWQAITDGLNEQNPLITRTVKEVRQKWEQMMIVAKKAYAKCEEHGMNGVTHVKHEHHGHNASEENVADNRDSDDDSAGLMNILNNPNYDEETDECAASGRPVFLGACPYFFDDLLERKTKTGPATPAMQYFWAVLRQAATETGLWGPAPPMKDIPPAQRDSFIAAMTKRVPGIEAFQAEILKRLAMALRNRRQYKPERRRINAAKKRSIDQTRKSGQSFLDESACGQMDGNISKPILRSHFEKQTKSSVNYSRIGKTDEANFQSSGCNTIDSAAVARSTNASLPKRIKLETSHCSVANAVETCFTMPLHAHSTHDASAIYQNEQESSIPALPVNFLSSQLSRFPQLPHHLQRQNQRTNRWFQQQQQEQPSSADNALQINGAADKNDASTKPSADCHSLQLECLQLKKQKLIMDQQRISLEKQKLSAEIAKINSEKEKIDLEIAVMKKRPYQYS